MINTKKYKQLHNLEINFCRHFKTNANITNSILKDYKEENFLERYITELELYLFQTLDCFIDLENREENIKYCFKTIDKFKEITTNKKGS